MGNFIKSDENCGSMSLFKQLSFTNYLKMSKY
jgi:hypothetical protein